jgi:uncharacterized protein involved in exopolysaccharide biosynthesis
MLKPVRNSAFRTKNDLAKNVSYTDVSVPQVESKPPSSLDISSAVRRRPFLAAAPLLLALLVGVPYAFQHARKEYRAEATIHVSPNYFKNLQEERAQIQVSYGRLVNQQILTLGRYDVLAEALKRLESKGIVWRNPNESEPEAVARLMTKLDIRPIPDSYEVMIAMNGENQAWLAPVVNTIVDTYLEKERNEEMADRSSRLTTLKEAKTRIDETLQRKLEQQVKLSQQLKVADLDKATPADDALLTGALQAREAARRKRIEAEAQISIMTSMPAGNSKNALTAQAEEAVANDASLHALTTSLLQRSFELRAKIEGLTPVHPLRQATEKELAAINNQLSEMPQGLVQETSSRMLTKLHADVDRARVLETELDKEVAAATSNVQGIAKQVQQAQGLSGEIDRLRKSQSTVNSVMELALEDGPSDYLRVFSSAQAPLAPSKSNLEKTLSGLAALGLLLGIVLCVSVDLIDQRIVAPTDVSRAVGFKPLGLLFDRAPGTEAFSEEHFWRLVNGIQRGVAAHGAKSIVLTPLRFARNPKALITDLSRALSLCGLKTVVVDANPQSSQDLTPTGSAEISDHGRPLLGALEQTDSTIPERIKIGLRRDPSRVIVLDRAMVAELRRQYDVVLIDAPSLLLCADMEFLPMIGDITLIVAEAGDATRSELIQGMDLLKRIGAPGVGVIMSQVHLRKAGRDLNRDFKRFTMLSMPAGMNEPEPKKMETSLTHSASGGR